MATFMDTKIAEFRDAPEIVGLVNAAYRGATGLRSWTTEAHFISGQRIDLERVQELLAKPGTLILLAYSGERLIGCVELQEEMGEAYLGMLTVHPDFQKHGMGSKILQAAERACREKLLCSAVHMHVISIRTELIAWYMRRGYSKTGKKSSFPYGDERFGQPMRNDLEFEVLRKSLD